MELTFSLIYIKPLNEHHSQNEIILFDFSRLTPIMPSFQVKSKTINKTL